ncbi:hypothetical protein COB57_02890 [Candidatus Peregrinibacteria bacterium]|nr:MAG: hypothetical protein COB57_02890 [Candidatus Peregrinibacteria bacterium]
MPKLYSSKHIIKILAQNGFDFISQKGSHQKFRKQGDPSFITIVPGNKKEIPYGTFRAIIVKAHLQESDFKIK